MLYFKNVDLVDTYHVSLRTVLNWIEAAKQGKLDLTLHTNNEKSYVANTARNIAIIEKIVAERKKYRNSRGHKIVSPRQEFYGFYNDEQILDIIYNLEVYHEVPRQYNYFDKGAEYWDSYTQRLATEEAPNLLTATQRLLKINQGYLDELLAPYKHVNVIDVGVGNAMPVKDLLQYLLDKKVLARYIGLDISAKMLDIARGNVEEWYDGQVSFEGHTLDINYDRFKKLLASEYLDDKGKDTINLVLMFGGTLSNLRNPDQALNVIHDSMGINDLFIYADKLDTETSRKYFDFSAKPGTSRLAPNHRFIFDLFNIDESYYDVEMGFNETICQRYITVKLKLALTIEFNFENGRRTISFNKGDTILLWRAWELDDMDIIDQFTRNNYHMMHESQTDDQEYVLAIARIESNY